MKYCAGCAVAAGFSKHAPGHCDL